MSFKNEYLTKLQEINQLRDFGGKRGIALDFLV
jgi:hypothetical protein